VLKLSSNVSDVFPKVFKLSSEVSECKPLHIGQATIGLHDLTVHAGKGLHSSTSLLNLSPFCH